jgi:hypothetical protein
MVFDTHWKQYQCPHSAQTAVALVHVDQMVALEFFFDTIHPHYGSGVDSASNRNEYQVSFLGG